MKKTLLALAMIAAAGAANAARLRPAACSTCTANWDWMALHLRSAHNFRSTLMPASPVLWIRLLALGAWPRTALFFGLNWTASGGTLLSTPGSYSLNTATGVVGASTGVAPIADGIINFTVGTGQIAGLINFAYGATTGIRVVDIWNINSNGSLTAAVVPGMENGPFPGFNARST